MHYLRSVTLFRPTLISSVATTLSASTRSSYFRSLSVHRHTFLTYQQRAYSTTNTAMLVDHKAVIVRRFENIIKSAEDKREYRGLELKNGLRVLLISDPKADKSAASMDVNVGHLMDPWELPGLAHFCEHMLFLGTNKYPSENEYSRYISSHGGITNAFTGSDHTNYHFDIAPDHLAGALDRFVQFFLCPQFTESATEREVCAVDSENSNNLQNDQWRMIQLERSLSKPGHDYGKFGTGSKKTLLEDARENNIEPREALLKFHQRHYSSDIMTCCIIGTETLDELENLVISLNFGEIAKKNASRKVWEEGPYDKEQLGVKIELVPVKDLRYLTLVFPIKDYKDEYRAQPTHYVSHLIGHEGPGSLLSELKRLGWVSSLSAGGRLLANGFGVFNISVDLSEDGLKHTEDVIRLIFHEIGLVKSNGPLKWVHDELRQLAETKFRFKDKETPINYATHLSSELQRIPFEDVICADYKMDQFKPELITELLEKLTPENMMYAVVSQEFANQEGNVREKWYQTEYRKTPIDEAFLSECHIAMKNVPDCLRIPERNEYIATKFDLKPREAQISLAPRLIRDDSWARVWFMQDNDFKLPKCSTSSCRNVRLKWPSMLL
uniref:Insulin-degrading enzyme n=1 Tax=Ascaris suum TaxID=6253 RepID=F1KTK3_ASCSU